MLIAFLREARGGVRGLLAGGFSGFFFKSSDPMPSEGYRGEGGGKGEPPLSHYVI